MSLNNYSCKNVITNYLQKYKVVTFIDLYQVLVNYNDFTPINENTYF